MKKLDLMHLLFGVEARGRRCRDCPCLVRCVAPTGRASYKCTVYGVSCGESTDWAVKWTACGRFGKPLEKGEYSVMHLRRRGPRATAPEVLPGQTAMNLDGD